MAVLSTLFSANGWMALLASQLSKVRSRQDLRQLFKQIPPIYRLRVIISVLIISTSVVGGLGYNLARSFNDARQSKSVHSYDEKPDKKQIKVSANKTREVVFQSGGKERKIIVRPTPKDVFDAHKRLFLGREGQQVMKSKKPKSGQFMNQFIAIWSIMVPRLRSKTSGLLLIHALFLALRTWLSLLVAELDGRIVRDLIAGNGKAFSKGIGLWFLLAIPASYTNSMIKFIQVKIAVAFRTRLVRYVHDIYLDSKLGYYKVTNVDGGIEGVDQYITADLTRFCDSVASLYSSLGKPSADFLIFSYQLSKKLGPIALMGIFTNYSLTAWLLQRIAPPFGKFAATQARLEGEYRNSHTKLIMNAEEIAFYEGAPLEHIFMKDSFRKLMDHISQILRIRISYNMFEDFMLKYSWSAWGYLFASIPVFLPTWTSSGRPQKSQMPSLETVNKDFQERGRMRDFITNKRLMLSLADAGGRMMYSIKDLAELAGYTTRVFQLLATLHRVHASAYGELPPPQEGYPPFSLASIHGTMQKGYNGIRFEQAPIAVPGLGKDLSAGELLIEGLTFKIEAGEHLLISGSNGVGKTSISRVLAGLWPVFDGLVSLPSNKEIHFLPQRPYLSSGTLRDQLIYPYTHKEMLESGRTDDDIMEILREVKLDYIPAREGGWETVKQWKDVFSGGEKQRVMFARVLFQKPKFAVVDEGTSAVSADVEGILYEVTKKHGITIITISHRVQLIKYHTAMLRVGLGDDGRDWQFEKTSSPTARLTAEAEIKSLKEQLKQVDEWKRRRAEVAELLSK